MATDLRALRDRGRRSPTLRARPMEDFVSAEEAGVDLVRWNVFLFGGSTGVVQYCWRLQLPGTEICVVPRTR
jgi:hypothetical protein